MRLQNSEGSTDHRTPRAGDTTFPAPPASQPLLGLLGGAGKQHVLNGATVFPGGAAWSPNPSPTLTVDGAYVLRLIQTDNDAAPSLSSPRRQGDEPKGWGQTTPWSINASVSRRGSLLGSPFPGRNSSVALSRRSTLHAHPTLHSGPLCPTPSPLILASPTLGTPAFCAPPSCRRGALPDESTPALCPRLLPHGLLLGSEQGPGAFAGPLSA